ncbi:MAG: DMT family transporter, partial [Actinomycetota bacterium]|nr:DMT family transporter [Actinomycetota bacterium]
ILLVVFALVGAIPFRVGRADVDFAGRTTSWLVPVVGLSLVAAVVAYTTGIAAARRLGARVASFVGLAEVLFAILFAWLLLDQRPSSLQLIGGLVVLAGIALVRVADRDLAEAEGAAALEIPLAGASS